MTSFGRASTVVNDKKVLVDASVYNPNESVAPVCPEAAPQSTGGAPYYGSDPISNYNEVQIHPGVGYPQHLQGEPMDVHDPASDINFNGYIILACFTAWCCCLALGIPAYIQAARARTLAEQDQLEEAEDMITRSKWLSIMGIVTGIIVIATSIFFSATHLSAYLQGWP